MRGQGGSYEDLDLNVKGGRKMKPKALTVPIAITSTLGLAMPGSATAGATEALSFVDIQDIIFFPDDDNDGTPNCDIFLPDGTPNLACFDIPQADIPETSSSASKLGIPDAGSSQVDPPSGRGPLNVDQACVARPPDLPAAQDPPFVDPCPNDPNTFTEVPDFPANNFARADALVRGAEGFEFPGSNCPADGEGVCGVLNNDNTDALSIAEVQLNEEGEPGVAESDSIDTFTFVLGSESGNSAVRLAFTLDWCRKAQLVNAVQPSIARASSNGNAVITDVDPDTPEDGVVFDANTSGLFPAVTALNGTTELTPAPGPLTGLVSEDALGTAGNPSCFPRPGDRIPVVVHTNPLGLTPQQCDDANDPTMGGTPGSCFIAQEGVEYSVNLNEGTDVDGLVFQEVPMEASKGYFCKQDPRAIALGEPRFPPTPVTLTDRFGTMDVTIGATPGLCFNPANKSLDLGADLQPPVDGQHSHCYSIRGIERFQADLPFETDNFGPDVARVREAREVCAPMIKTLAGDDGEFNTPDDVSVGSTDGSDYKCYRASSGQTQPNILLADQFGLMETEVRGLDRVCMPVLEKNGQPLDQPDFDFLACYDIGATQPARQIIADDQFSPGGISLRVERTELFCEPATIVEEDMASAQ